MFSSPFFPYQVSPDAAALQFAASDITVSESGVTAVVIVERLGDASNTVSVLVHTISGGTAPSRDYTPESSRITFQPGQRKAVFEFFVHGNSQLDGSRTVLVALGEPSSGAELGALTKATVTILDDESEGAGLLMFADTELMGERDGSVTVRLNRAGGSRGLVTVDFQVLSGTSAYRPGGNDSTQHVVFADGVTAQSVQMRLWESASTEECVRLVFFNPTGGAAFLPHDELWVVR